MDNTLHLIFLFFGFGLNSCFDVTRKYHYVGLKMTWTDAQRYCRDSHTDLATIDNNDDVSRLNKPATETTLVWIGLNDDPQSWKGVMGSEANSWRWSASSQTSATGYQNWSPDQSNFSGGNVTCVKVDRYGKWNSVDCHTKSHFICYQDTNPPGQKTYIEIKRLLTWEKAQTYCRTSYTDLASIENAQENTQMNSIKTSPDVWIGLYRIPWMWSDKSSSSFKNWKLGQPNNYAGNEYCVLEDVDRLWHDHPCNEKFPFWCHDDLKVKRLVRMRIQTLADVSDPAINTKLLQQIGEKLRMQGWTDFKLRWTIPPKKQEEK